MKTENLEFADKLKEMLDTLPEDSSMVVAFAIPMAADEDKCEEGMDSVWLDHIVGYKGEYCAEALTGLMLDETLIEQGIVETVMENMEMGLQARQEAENDEDETGQGDVSDARG